jgi:uncharacterized protein
VPIERSSRRVGAGRLRKLARDLLDASTLCAIATVSSGGRAHANTAYFAWTPELDLVWLSDRAARHSRNLRENGSAAVVVYDSAQTWGRPDRGVQLFGTAREAADEDAAAAYAARFPQLGGPLSSAYRLYRFRPRRMKLFDERALGAGTFVTARVRSRGELVWERTDVYRP